MDTPVQKLLARLSHSGNAQWKKKRKKLFPAMLQKAAYRFR
jgi:hypothetical protein